MMMMMVMMSEVILGVERRKCVTDRLTGEREVWDQVPGVGNKRAGLGAEQRPHGPAVIGCRPPVSLSPAARHYCVCVNSDMDWP